MKTPIRKYWFFFGMVVMIAAAWLCPQAALFLKQFYILKIGVFLTFFLVALTLNAYEILHHIRTFKALLAGVVSCYVLIPLLTLALARGGFPHNSDLFTGACILAVLPVTISSGVVLTRIANGSVSLSLLINIVTNTLAIVIAPIGLHLLLGYQGTVSIDSRSLITNLFFTILIPTLLGQILRPWLGPCAERYQKPASIFAQLVVLLIIYSGFADSSARITQLGWRCLVFFLFAAGLHVLVLAMNCAIARLLRLDRAARIALILQASQKSLTVGYIIWLSCFAQTFPLALLPIIAYHLTQLVLDSLLAHRYQAGGAPSA